MVLYCSSLNWLRQGLNEITLYVPVTPAFFLLLEYLRAFTCAVPSCPVFFWVSFIYPFGLS